MRGRASKIALGISVVALLMVVGPHVSPSSQATAGTGVINTLDYGTELSSGGAWCWRGYAFKVSIPTTVTHIVGGPDAAHLGGFQGAIYEAGTNTDGVPNRATKLLAEVTFPTSNPSAADSGRTSVKLSQNIVLEPDTWYIVAQGRTSGRSLHFFVGTLNVPDLIEASFRISDWQPQQNNAFTLGSCEGTASNRATSALRSTPTKVAVGFRFESGASVPQIETLDNPLTGRLNDRGNAPTALYMEYSTNSNMSNLSVVLDQAGYEGSVPYVYSSSVAGLSPGTTYYYRARAINDAGAAVGATKSFMTPGIPAVPTILSAAPGLSSATLQLSFADASEVTNVQYSLDNGASWISRSPASASTTLEIPNLIDGTSYSIRVRAVNQGITGSASSPVSVTPGLAKPTVATSSISAVTTSGAMLAGNVSNDGQATVSARGFVWSTSPNPVLGGGTLDITAGAGTGTFSAEIANLSPGTTYYVRAYASNSQGTAYGSQLFFTTTQLVQELTFADALPDVVYGADSFTVAPTTDADALSPELAASPSSVCTVTGPVNGQFTVTIEGAGDCQLTASQVGNTTYSSATPVIRSFTVQKATQAVTFSALQDRPFADTTFSLSANASSGLTVSFASSTTNVCTVSGINATIVSAGTCTIVASQTGDHNFLPADTVTRSFEVTKTAAQIWFNSGLVQFVQPDGSGVGLPSVAVIPPTAGTLVLDWHDGTPPTAPGRYRINLSLESNNFQATPVATFVTVLAAPTGTQSGPAPTIGPVSLRDQQGEPVSPVLAPSVTTFKRDDQPVAVTVTRPTPTQVKIEDTGGQLELVFAARLNRDGTERPLAVETDLVLLAGGVLEVAGLGYQSNTAVEVWMFSEPVLLGVVEVGADGSFTGQLDVPPGVNAGEHVIQLNGTTASGQLGSSSIGVLVEIPSSDDTPEPVRLTNGQLVRPTSTGPAALASNRVLQLTVTQQQRRSLFTRGNTSLLLRSAADSVPPFTVSLTPETARGGHAGVVDQALVVTRKATVVGELDGLAPFSSVYVWLLSEPKLLGRVVTDQNGTVVLQLSLPKEATYGRHSVQLVAMTQDGQRVAVAVGLWLLADTTPLTDVTFTQTHGAAIMTLQQSGVINGFNDGRFHANRVVTRGHAATMLTRLFALDTPDVTDLFADTISTTHATGIAALVAAGVANGYDDGLYRPGVAMTRGQMAVMLSRLLELDQTEPGGVVFTDLSGRADATAIGQLYAAGLVTGFADGTFKPDAPITRGQFATLIVNAHYHHTAN